MSHIYYKYNDIFTVDRGILKYCKLKIKTVHNNVDNTDVSDDVYSDKYLNILCLSNFGSLPLSPIITAMIDNNGYLSDISLQDLGNIIYHRYHYNWDKYYDILSIDYELIQKSDTYRYTMQDTTVINSDTTIFNEVKDIYGFNSVDSNGVRDTNNISDSQNTRNSRNMVEHTTQEGIWYGALDIQNAISNELKLREKSYIDYIMRDLKDFCTLAVYL